MKEKQRGAFAAGSSDTPVRRRLAHYTTRTPSTNAASTTTYLRSATAVGWCWMADVDSSEESRHPLQTPAIVAVGVAVGMLLQGNSLAFSAFSAAFAFTAVLALKLLIVGVKKAINVV